MREFTSIEAFVKFLETRRSEIPFEQKRGAAEAGEMLVHEAQALIGTEDASWPPLADFTVEEKIELGYVNQVSATDPLLRTGHMRGSVEASTNEHEVIVGSHDPVAFDQEHGTKHIPPRPYISTAFIRHGHEAASHVFRCVIACLTGSPHPKPREHHRGE